MSKKRRTLVLLSFMGVLLLLGFIFQQFILANLILPVATVAWLLLRIFVLSIDQQIYWWLLICLVVFLVFLRVFARPQAVKAYQPPASNGTLDSLHRWRSSMLSSIHETGENNNFKRELMWLLTSMYSKQQGPAHFEIKEAFAQRQIPLPEHVHAFLFSNEPVEPKVTFFHHPVGYLKQVLQSIRRQAGKKIRKWSGREAEEYYQAIDEALTFMETTLEIKYDVDPTDTPYD